MQILGDYTDHRMIYMPQIVYEIEYTTNIKLCSPSREL